jgi:hypothetical protein
MSAAEHDRERLGAYALGVLDPDEAREVSQHIAGCDDCRREVGELASVRPLLDVVPAEAFIDGPPLDDLVLQRTLRQLRATEVPVRRFSPVVMGIAAAAALVVVLGGGILIGRQTTSTSVASPPTSSVPANARIAQVTNSATGASMRVTLIPKAGWVSVTAFVSGVKAGTKCLLQVVPRSGAATLAGSWLVSPQGAKDGTMLQGTALVDPAQVAAVRVVTTDGETVVSVPV